MSAELCLFCTSTCGVEENEGLQHFLRGFSPSAVSDPDMKQDFECCERCSCCLISLYHFMGSGLPKSCGDDDELEPE